MKSSQRIAALTVLSGGALAILAGCERDATTPATPDAPTATAPPAGADTQATAPPAIPPANAKVAEFLGLRGPKPASWTWLPPESTMRAANWVVPGSEGGNQAHLVVFKGIGGGPEMNIARWVGQFRTPDERPVEPVTQQLEVGDLSITVVELRGEWMKMGEQWFTADQLMLGVVIESPDRPEIYVRFAGDAATVEANREAFMALLRGLERVPA